MKNAFANNVLTNIKLSKTQLPEKFSQWGFFDAL